MANGLRIFKLKVSFNKRRQVLTNTYKYLENVFLHIGRQCIKKNNNLQKKKPLGILKS